MNQVRRSKWIWKPSPQIFSDNQDSKYDIRKGWREYLKELLHEDFIEGVRLYLLHNQGNRSKEAFAQVKMTFQQRLGDVQDKLGEFG